MLYGVLPVREVVLGLGQLLNVAGGIFQSDQLAAIRQFDGVGEGRGPTQWRQPSLSTSVLKPPGIRGASPSLVALQIGQGAPGAPQVHEPVIIVGQIFASLIYARNEQARWGGGLGTPHPPDRARQTRRWQSASPAPPILIFSAHAFLVQIGPTARHRRLGMAKNL
jgi:hypothetical protein